MHDSDSTTGPAPETASTEDRSTRLLVLLFTDIVGSVDLKMRLGDAEAGRLIARHDEFFRQAIASAADSDIVQDTGDGFLARFATVSEAVKTALRFQWAIHTEPWGDNPIHVRVGVHEGEVSRSGKLSGLAVDIAARVMGLAMPDQILTTRTVFDNARQHVRRHPETDSAKGSPELRWIDHGPYLFKGVDDPMDVCEVGVKGVAPLKPPPDGDKARRAIPAGEEEMYGWRPAVGLAIPRRDSWILQGKIGEGGFGEVWLAQHAKTRTRRVVKFCFDVERLRSFKRELTLFRLLREALGDRPDIACIHDIQLDKPPFYLESEFTPQGNLADWAERQGGIDQVPLATRLDLMVRVCDAVSAAHSIGILHKDIKPSNVLIYEAEDGSPRPRLSDFGIGLLTDRTHLERFDIAAAGFTETLQDDSLSSRTGTRMYAPPESLAGHTFTIQGDVYALGVLLYQTVAGDLNRPLAQGWETDIDDPLLQQDIARCIAGRREERLDTVSELAGRLRVLDRRHKARRWRKMARLALICIPLLLLLYGLLTSARDEVLQVSRLDFGEYRNFTRVFFDTINSSDDIPLKIAYSGVTSPGSLVTLQQIQDGEADIGLIQSNTRMDAENARTIAYVFDENFYWFVDQEKDPYEDNSHRVCSLPEGSQTRVDLTAFLEFHGMRERFDIVDGTYEECWKKLKDHEVDSAFFISGSLNKWLKEMARLDHVRLVNIRDREGFRGEPGNQHLKLVLIEKGTMDRDIGLPRSHIETIAARATLVARSDLPDKLVYELTRTLELKELKHTYQTLKVDRVEEGDTKYLEHPGARRWFEHDEPSRISQYYPEIAIAVALTALALQLIVYAIRVRRAVGRPGS